MRKTLLHIILLLTGCASLTLHAQSVVRYHYWIDSTRINETITELSAATEPREISWSPNLTGIREGMHTLHYRLQDSNNEWSVPYAWQFFVIRRIVNTTIEATDIEYWVDTDSDNRSTMAVTNDSVAFTLDASTLREGMHTLYYRFKDNEGEYSVPHTWQFFVVRHVVNTIIKVTDIEYWVDTDYDNRSTMTVTDDSVAFTLDASTLRECMHTLYYRFRDNEGEHSYLHAWDFFVARYVNNDSINVTEVEYWVDTIRSNTQNR